MALVMMITAKSPVEEQKERSMSAIIKRIEKKHEEEGGCTSVMIKQIERRAAWFDYESPSIIPESFEPGNELTDILTNRRIRSRSLFDGQLTLPPCYVISSLTSPELGEVQLQQIVGNNNNRCDSCCVATLFLFPTVVIILIIILIIVSN